MFNSVRSRFAVHRVLAVDAGSRCLKLALVQSHLGGAQILHEESIDLHAEGLVTPAELKQQLHRTLGAWEQPPVALTLPAHLSTAHLIHLPSNTAEEVRQLIEAEAVKMSGVSDSAIVHDFAANPKTSGNQHQFWVSLAKEGDVETTISQLDLGDVPLCEVTDAANSLIAAYRATGAASSEAILVHFGAEQTLLVVLDQGLAVFAGTLSFGSDEFTRAIARVNECPLAEAEALKQTAETLVGPTAVPGLATVVDQWAAELRRFIAGALVQRLGDQSKCPPFAYMGSGKGFSQPGLLDYLSTRADLPLQPWPGRADLPAPGFELAFGTALQALGLAAQPISLLPPARRKIWKQGVTTRKIAFANNLLLGLCFLVLGGGLWLKFSQVRKQQALLTKVQAASAMWQTNRVLTEELRSGLEVLRPLLQSRQDMRDLLETLALLEQTRSNRAFWFVLLADQQSYFQSAALAATNYGSGSNFIYGPLAIDAAMPPPPATNSPAKPGLIAELCVPGGLEEARKVLSSIVNELKPRPLFSKVDLLSDDLRQGLADPKVVLPNRHFALSFNFASAEFQLPKPTSRASPTDQPANRNGYRGHENPRPSR